MCDQDQFNQGGQAFMLKKRQDHFERRTSVCNLKQEGNAIQKQIFQDYEEGNLCLSDNSCKANSFVQHHSGSDLSDLSDDDKKPKQHKN